MKTESLPETTIRNSALSLLKPLVGEWETVGAHPFFPNKVLHGHASFNWMEDGAFLVWRSEINEEGFPKCIAIFGTDDTTGEIFMLYFDERKVSREYDVSVHNHIIQWWRNAPHFSQRYSWTLTNDNNTIIGKGELCKDGNNWKKDLDLTFIRIS